MPIAMKIILSVSANCLEKEQEKLDNYKEQISRGYTRIEAIEIANNHSMILQMMKFTVGVGQ